MALAAKMDEAQWRTYVVTSDAEHQCGLHWEAVMTAAKFKLDNLTCIIDRNFIQIDGSTEDVMPLEPLAEKYRAFNWEVFECDGNDIAEFIATMEKAKEVRGKPQVVIANTLPGKGVAFMEGDYRWHGKPPDRKQADEALSELSARRELMVKHDG
jgi:transketolase